VSESGALLSMARFDSAADTALSGLGHARQAGLDASWMASALAFNASEALLARGRAAEARALIEPLTDGPPVHDYLAMHQARAEIDLLRGDIDAAVRRRRLIDAIPDGLGLSFVRASAQRAAELAVWTRRSEEAVGKVGRVLPVLENPDMTIACGWRLAVGMRACADLAEQARARRDEPAVVAAEAAADGLAAWVGRMSGASFTEHPFAVTIPAERATWEAERTRLAGTSDPDAWSRAAQAWQDLGCPHRDRDRGGRGAAPGQLGRQHPHRHSAPHRVTRPLASAAPPPGEAEASRTQLPQRDITPELVYRCAPAPAIWANSCRARFGATAYRATTFPSRIVVLAADRLTGDIRTCIHPQSAVVVVDGAQR
jgi:hypothetical protein